MIDHTGFSVSDFERSKRFYAEALTPLMITVVVDISKEDGGGSAHAGFGAEGKPFFWIGEGPRPANSVHLAFAAGTRGAVDAFYAAAMKAGGRDNGGPGLRLHYHPNYYAAFVFDPDGNNIEAVCHRPE